MNVFIGQAIVSLPFDRKYPDVHPNNIPTYTWKLGLVFNGLKKNLIPNLECATKVNWLLKVWCNMAHVFFLESVSDWHS